jgi:hypothetical protein
LGPRINANFNTATTKKPNPPRRHGDAEKIKTLKEKSKQTTEGTEEHREDQNIRATVRTQRNAAKQAKEFFGRRKRKR